MKKICFVALFFCSKIVLSSDHQSPTALVLAVDNFLKQFEVARAFKESKNDFLKRVKESEKFEHVTYAEYSEKLFKKDRATETNDNKKRYLLGLFALNTYAVKQCGFWGGDEDGFYVSTKTKVVGKGLARFQEKGRCEWLIQFPNGLLGSEFENTPIQPLLNYLIAQNESEFVIPLNSQAVVSFCKEEKQITARLKYK